MKRDLQRIVSVLNLRADGQSHITVWTEHNFLTDGCHLEVVSIFCRDVDFWTC